MYTDEAGVTTIAPGRGQHAMLRQRTAATLTRLRAYVLDEVTRMTALALAS